MIKFVMPIKKYRKLHKISIKYGDVPEYFVYDKEGKKFFFVAKHLSESRMKWISKAKNMARIEILEGMDYNHHVHTKAL
jgi:hypothetical protein